MSETLKEELARLEAEIEGREARVREIHRTSLAAPEADKVGPDFLSEMLAAKPWPKLQYPIQVHGLAWGEGPVWKTSRRGNPWVAVRPCEGDGQKTYLGILIGNAALSVSARYDRESGVLCLTPTMHNPAIWVPDLGKVVFGAESWWGAIKGPDDLREITNADIDGAWYVRALRDLEGQATEERE